MSFVVRKVNLRASLGFLTKEIPPEISIDLESIAGVQKIKHFLFGTLGESLVEGVQIGVAGKSHGRNLFLLKEEEYRGVVAESLLGTSLIESVEVLGLPGINFLSAEVRKHNKRVLQKTAIDYLLLLSISIISLLGVENLSTAFVSYQKLNQLKGTEKVVLDKYKASKSLYDKNLYEYRRIEKAIEVEACATPITPFLEIVGRSIGQGIMVTRIEEKSRGYEISGEGIHERFILQFKNNMEQVLRKYGYGLVLKQTDSQGGGRVSFKIAVE